MFDYRKFLSENNLTTTSKLRDKFLKEEDISKLVSKKDSLLAKYKAGEISLDQYKTKMGNTSQKIKTTKADLDPKEEPATEDGEETTDSQEVETTQEI
jgi:hypothetical protein